jgi:hypothetical protein
MNHAAPAECPDLTTVDPAVLDAFFREVAAHSPTWIAAEHSIAPGMTRVFLQVPRDAPFLGLGVGRTPQAAHVAAAWAMLGLWTASDTREAETPWGYSDGMLADAGIQIELVVPATDAGHRALVGMLRATQSGVAERLAAELGVGEEPEPLPSAPRAAPAPLQPLQRLRAALVVAAMGHERESDLVVAGAALGLVREVGEVVGG